MDNLSRLINELARVGEPASIDDEARKVLLYALGLAEPREIIIEDPMLCPNCGAACDLPKSPYCSSWCREQASVIRQFRSNVASGTAFDPEKQAVYGQILWWLVGGGYPRPE